jgi:formamidopyrimidine-DNA glycosylase
VGNIYASEALFRAGIRPTTRASKVSLPRARRLHAAIREVLARALEAGGSTLRDFSNAQGQTGYFQLETAVYDRAGEPCKVCEQPIRQIRQGQRSTFYCVQCQKP